jgi:hypothetical protein
MPPVVFRLAEKATAAVCSARNTVNRFRPCARPPPALRSSVDGLQDRIPSLIVEHRNVVAVAKSFRNCEEILKNFCRSL